MSGHFLHGAAVLLVAGVINRILGFIYQIVVMRTIGPEGVGLFSMAFPIYIMVLVLATAGIPLAVAKLVAEEVAKRNLAGAYKILKISLAIVAITSTSLTLFMILGAPFLKTHILPNPKVYYCFLFLIPGITIVSICSVFRGFFQGLQMMTPTAISQIVEQLTRVVTGITIAYLLLPRGVEYAAIGLSLGVVIGELAGFMIMLRIYATRKPASTGQYPTQARFKTHLYRIFSLAIPVTLTRFVATALLSIQAVLIPKRLVATGMSMSHATSTYGQFVGIAEALLFIPGVVTVSLATALVPAMSDAMALNNSYLVQSRVQEATRITIQVGLPMAAIFLLLSDELCGILFGYPEAGVSLRILALSGPFLYLQQATTGILQGLGEAQIPFKNLVISSFGCLLGIYYLTAIPQLGIKGSALAVGAGYVIMAMLNLFALRRLTGFQMGSRENIFKPLVSATSMSMLIIFLKSTMISNGYSSGMTLLTTLLLGGLAYLCTMIITGGFNQDDLNKFKQIFRF